MATAIAETEARTPASGPFSSGLPPAGAMTIDVEDWYHVHAYKQAIDRADWPALAEADRVVASTDRLLDLFAETGTRATFFVLGLVAERHPALVQRIVEGGHQLASHGREHWAVFDQDRTAFAEDLRRAKATLEDAGGVEVTGYRAPSFSFDPRSPWAYEVLAETGHRWSSSSHPIAHDAYGDPNAPRGPHHDPATGIVEIPVTTAVVAGRRVPMGGGGFFRLLPLAWFRKAHARARREGLVPNFYLHPWEVDPAQPRVQEAPLRSRFRHRVGLGRCEARLGRLLQNLPRGHAPWTRMDEAYDGWLDADGGR